MYAAYVVLHRVQSGLVICACRGPQRGVTSLRGRDRAVIGMMAELVFSEYQSATAFVVTLSRHEKRTPGVSPTASTIYTASQWHHLDGRPASFPSLAVKPEEILGVRALQLQQSEDCKRTAFLCFSESGAGRGHLSVQIRLAPLG